MPYISSKTIEPIQVYALDSYNAPVSGLTNLFLKIRRKSDDFVLDWSDNTFKTAGSVVTSTWVLTEIDGTNLPGEYKFTKTGYINGFDPAAVTNIVANDTYFFRVTQVGSATAFNMPQVGEVTLGGYVDEIGTVRKNVTNRLELAPGMTNNWILYEDDGVTPALTWSVADYLAQPIALLPKTPSRRGKAT